MTIVAQFHWNTCPPVVRAQVEGLLAEIRATLAEDLIGVYLHGSLVMGCFNPARSDLDLLVITGERMAAETRRILGEMLLQRSNAPCPVEISFLSREQVAIWRYPTPFDLHYSEGWRTTYQRDLANDAWRSWGTPEPHDPDLAAHMTIMNRRGVCLYGPPIAEIFPGIPAADYIDSIMADIAGAHKHIAEQPVYLTLNLCRVYGFLKAGLFLSKDEGGVWALQILPEQHHQVLQMALDAYRGLRDESGFEQCTLELLAIELEQAIQACLRD